MAFDMVGGIFRSEGESAAGMLLEEEAEISQGQSVGKTSVNLTPEMGSASVLTSPFTIDVSKQYMGYQRKGRLVISAFGSGEETTQAGKPEDIVRHFSGLTLRFVFHQFAFKNPCLGVIRLDGEIQCEVEGDFEVLTKKFLGEARCTNGPKSSPAPLLYITGKQNYEIGLNATLHIDGNIYYYSNYSYEGEIIIDGATHPINDLIANGSACSAQ